MIKTFMLFIFCIAWSSVLRHVAFLLIKDCFEKKTTIPILSAVDLLGSIYWLIAAHQITTYIPGYFIFLSALYISMYTDRTVLLISRFVSLYLAPLGIIFAAFNFLPIDPLESFLAASIFYFLFWSINKIFFLWKGHNGIGQGDFELMACIGAFTGMLGCWFTILLGSLIGTIISGLYIFYSKTNNKELPFGLFLAFGASIFVMFQYQIIQILIDHMYQ